MSKLYQSGGESCDSVTKQLLALCDQAYGNRMVWNCLIKQSMDSVIQCTFIWWTSGTSFTVSFSLGVSAKLRVRVLQTTVHTAEFQGKKCTAMVLEKKGETWYAIIL